LAFGIWAFLVVYAYSSEKSGNRRSIIWIWIEIMQYFYLVSFHRAYDLADVLADFIGALLGIISLWAFQRFSNKMNNSVIYYLIKDCVM
jgi:VanZ family protein